jgi:hypothetical protein
MSIIAEERLSDSSYIETITHGYTESSGTSIRPAEIHWHLVLVKQCGKARAIVVGPWTTAGVVSYAEGAEILWIKFKLGTFMPALPTRNFLNTETILPEAAQTSFWLKGSRWQLPDFENADTFVDRLVRDEVLARDPMVNAVREDHPQAYSSRTIRHRFLRATGLPQSHIHQVERAQRAAALLRQGVPIADTIFEAGYFDQPHLTRSLKQWVGHTPAQLIRQHTAR